MAKRKPVYVLGTGLSHDGSVCLLRDGEIQVAIEKERLTRRKHDGMNDRHAVQYCVEAAGIRLEDVDLVVQNANFGMFVHGNEWFRGPRTLPAGVPVVTISHHLAHAYSAFHASPFDDAAIVIIDGCGNAYDECLDLAATVPERPLPAIAHLYFEKDSAYAGRGSAITPIYKDFSPWGFSHREYSMHPPTTQHSIGGLYLAASVYVFGGFDDAGKLMGLAPYGRPGVYDREIFELRDGRVFVRYDWMADFTRPAQTADALKRDFQYYADIARWVQQEVERAVLYVIASRRASVDSHNLCYTGGVALNAVANGRIVRESGYDRVFIQPAAGDNGLAIGCAYYGWCEVLGRERRRHSGSTCFGRTYSDARCEAAGADGQRDGTVHVERRDDYVEAAARLLADGKVVGWFQHGAEFGPRALGNRSLLADPRVLEHRERINRDIKCREDYRPFAPSVLEDEVSTYFEFDGSSPYMLLVVPTRDEWRSRLAAVVHCDGSARIQTVSAERNPLYHALLRAFQRHTGLGVLLNTSLNRRGMPIVETPEEAVQFFLSSYIDALVLGSVVLTKTPAWPAQSHQPPVVDADLHETMEARLRDSPDGDHRGIVRLSVTRSRSWLVDLANRRVSREGIGPEAVVDATITIDERELTNVLASPDAVQWLFGSGRMQLLGDSQVARRAIRAISRPAVEAGLAR